jgi:hypothetical protein
MFNPDLLAAARELRRDDPKRWSQFLAQHRVSPDRKDSGHSLALT